MLNKDLNSFITEKVTLDTATGENISSVVNSNTHSVMFFVDLSGVTGFTTIAFKVQIKNTNDINWVDAETFGATLITAANMDTDALKRTFTIGAAGADSGNIRLVATVVGTATGTANVYCLQEAVRFEDANSNKR